jgi:hypothetical protein
VEQHFVAAIDTLANHSQAALTRRHNLDAMSLCDAGSRVVFARTCAGSVVSALHAIDLG